MMMTRSSLWGCGFAAWSSFPDLDGIPRNEAMILTMIQTMMMVDDDDQIVSVGVLPGR
jgi:hypothetical protein